MAKRIAILDANVLYSAPLRDLLMWLGVESLYQPKWTNQIHEEWIQAVLKQRSDLDRVRLERTRDMMNQVMPEALVEGFEALGSGLRLPDPGDRHVLAAAIRAEAHIIVTLNLKDFPDEALQPFEIEALHPDTFIVRLLELDLSGVLTTMKAHRAALKNPPKSPEAYLNTLEKQGLTCVVSLVRPYQGLI